MKLTTKLLTKVNEMQHIINEMELNNKHRIETDSPECHTVQKGEIFYYQGNRCPVKIEVMDLHYLPTVDAKCISYKRNGRLNVRTLDYYTTFRSTQLRKNKATQTTLRDLYIANLNNT